MVRGTVLRWSAPPGPAAQISLRDPPWRPPFGHPTWAHGMRFIREAMKYPCWHTGVSRAAFPPPGRAGRTKAMHLFPSQRTKNGKIRHRNSTEVGHETARSPPATNHKKTPMKAFGSATRRNERPQPRLSVPEDLGCKRRVLFFAPRHITNCCGLCPIVQRCEAISVHPSHKAIRSARRNLSGSARIHAAIRVSPPAPTATDQTAWLRAPRRIALVSFGFRTWRPGFLSVRPNAR